MVYGAEIEILVRVKRGEARGQCIWAQSDYRGAVLLTGIFGQSPTLRRRVQPHSTPGRQNPMTEIETRLALAEATAAASLATATEE